jgi:hypothetical protein
MGRFGLSPEASTFLVLLICGFISFVILVWLHWVEVKHSKSSVSLTPIISQLKGLQQSLGGNMATTIQNAPIINQKSLSDMLETKATDADYEEYFTILIPIIRELYATYEFLRQDPAPDDFTSANCLIFDFSRDEFSMEYTKLFRLAIDRGLDDKEIVPRFVDKLVNGEVLELGTVQIVPEQSGVSSVLQGKEIRVLVTFMTEEYAVKRAEVLDKNKAEQDNKIDELNKAQEEGERLRDIRLKAYAEMDKATEVLSLLTQKNIDAYDLSEELSTMKGIADKIM